ncbi:MAG: site-specific integrase [Acidobacteria bacterium]|nr:site-specific integrase [Acidobacteriota bacterium]
MTAKKSSDRGLFRRTDSPHWWIRYSDKNGHIRRESTGTSEKKLAREILAKKHVLVAENRHLDIKRIPKCTFSELCDRYWKTDGQHKRMHGLEGMLKTLKQRFGSLQLIEISTEKVERFLSHRVEVDKVSPATRNRDRAILSILFNKAIRWELLEANPVKPVQKFKENNKRTRFLDRNEIERLLTACEPKPKDYKKAKREKRQLKNLVLMALNTGMRRQEIFNLRWEDIDFRNRLIKVVESKSGKSRFIPINGSVEAVLKTLPSRFKKGLVFPSLVTSSRITDLKKSFHTALMEAKITNFTFHDLRHHADSPIMPTP